MCKCTPEIRTPFCGRGDCLPPGYANLGEWLGIFSDAEAEAAAQASLDRVWEQAVRQALGGFGGREVTDIDALRALYEKATAGEWEIAGRPRKRWISAEHPDLGSAAVATMPAMMGRDEDDAALIVALHNAFPALASELEAARKVVAEMREMVDQCDLTITWRNERGMKPATDISIFAPTALSGVIKIKRYFEQALAEYLRVMEEQR